MTLAARAKRSPFRAGLACGALHAACFALMFPPVFLWGLAFVALAPLMWLAWVLGSPDALGSSEPGAAATGNRAGQSRRKETRLAVLAIFLAVMPMWAFHHWWLSVVTPVGFPVLILYLSLYAPLFVWLAARWRRRVGDTWKFWLALPVLWVGLEMLRGAVVWDGYPWFFVGHPVIANRGLSTFGQWIGATGVSLLVAGFSHALLANARVWPRLKRGQRACLVALGVTFIFILALSDWMMARSARATSAHVTVAVIQTNIPQDNRQAWSFPQRRADFEKFQALTRTAASAEANGRPDLIVWPETMFPGIALNDAAVRAERAAQLTFRDDAAPGGSMPSTIFVDELLALHREISIPMLVGAIAKEGLRIDTIEDPDGRTRVEFDAAATFNSAFVINNAAVQPDRYDKIKLTPFGEYMPYISWSDWLERKLLALGAGGMTFDLNAGRDYRALRIPRVAPAIPNPTAPEGRELRIATPICFEATMPGVCRRLVFNGGLAATRQADVLINLTNDGWFADSPGGRENHLLLARWRCIELATPMVRAANTGISCVIDAVGSVTQSLDKKTEGVLRGMVSLPMEGSPPTLYARTGDIVGWTSLALTALFTALTFFPREPRGPSAVGATA